MSTIHIKMNQKYNGITSKIFCSITYIFSWKKLNFKLVLADKKLGPFVIKMNLWGHNLINDVYIRIVEIIT